MWLRRFPWLDITAPCSGDKDGGRTVDREREGEVRSETGIMALFHRLDDGLASLPLCEGLQGASRSRGDRRVTGFWGEHPRIGKTAA